jgi:hypothetical protein
VAEEILPKFELVVETFVETGGNTIMMGEQRSRPAGSNDAKALAAPGEPGFEIAAGGVRK